MIYDVIIIGAGPAGMAAALYAKSAGLSTLIIEQWLTGGRLNEIDKIYNYPGFESISGSELAEKMAKQIEGIKIVYDKALKIVKGSDGSKTIICLSSQQSAKNVIVAIGTKPKKIDIHIDEKYLSYCEICDGSLCLRQNLVVIGGGNSAFTCALYLSRVAKNIHLLIRKDKPRADKSIVELVENCRNIKIMYNTELDHVSGNRAYLNNGITIKVFKIFVKIGEDINKIDTDLTEKDGVFLAGSCSGLYPNQIITAESDAVSKFIKNVLITYQA